MVLLVADIGGTNTTIALVKKNKLLQKKHFLTQKIQSFPTLVNEYVNQSKTSVSRAVLSIAGPIQEEKGDVFSHLTNANVTISQKELLKKTALKKVTLLNDLEALGYAINTLPTKERTVLVRAKNKQGPGLVFAIGTGLGKAVLEKTKKGFRPLASEFGETSPAINSQEELDIVLFIQKKTKKKVIVFEDFLSGRGIEYIYEFYTKKVLLAQEVMSLKNKEAKKTRKLFSTLLARACKNEVLNNLATTLYLGGGVLVKNPGLINKDFMKEFYLHDNKEHLHILKQTKIILLNSYETTLKGCIVMGKL